MLATITLVSGLVWVWQMRGVGNDTEALARTVVPKCTLYALTQWQCPSCGMGRSVLAASSGRIGESVAYHPLGIVFCVLLLVALVEWWRGSDGLWRWIVAQSKRWPVRIGALLCFFIFMFWSVMRNLRG